MEASLEIYVFQNRSDSRSKTNQQLVRADLSVVLPVAIVSHNPWKVVTLVRV